MAHIGEVSKQLSERAESVAAMLLPKGKRVGLEWKVGSINGEAGESLGVHLKGERAGLWSDFATGNGGDLLDLWVAVRGVKLNEAIREAKSYLGITEPSFEPSRTKNYKKPTARPGTKRIDRTPAEEYLMQERKLSKATLDAYQIAGRNDETHGWQVVFPFKREGELINVKYLALKRDDKGKKIMSVETGCELALFGWQAVPENARSIIICEGEIDALSWYEYGYVALSVPNGAGNDKWIENEFGNLERFDSIYLSYDMDKDGEAGVAKVIDRLGRHRTRVVRLPYKDCNECLKEGVSQSEITHIFSSAQTQDPNELKNASAFVDEVIDLFHPKSGVEPGFETPFKELQGGKLRFRPGEVTVWTGFSGHGKSMLISQVLLFAGLQGEKACVAATEMPPKRWLKRATRQATALELPDEKDIRDVHKWFESWLWLFNVTGTSKGDRLLEVFEYAWQRYNISQFLIDSLMFLGWAEDDYNSQKLFMEKFSDFVLATNTHGHVVIHSRKSENEKKVVGKMDVKGTGALTDAASNVISAWRNKEKEETISMIRATGGMIDQALLESPDAMLVCSKQRNGDWEDRLPLWYERASMQYCDEAKPRPKRYLDYAATYDPNEEWTA